MPRDVYRVEEGALSFVSFAVGIFLCFAGVRADRGIGADPHP